MITEVIIILSLFLLMCLKLNKKPQELPPGEWGLPILGYLPRKGENISHFIKRLHDKHGKLFTVKLGSRVTIFLCDYETIKNTFSKLSASGRPNMYSLDIYNGIKNAGLIMCDGHIWNANRRFVLRALRDFGLGKSSLEHTINKETETFIQNIKTKVDNPIEVGLSLNVAVFNVVWGLLADMRYDIEDDEIKYFIKLFNEGFSIREGPMKILDFYPWLIPFVPGYLKNHWMKATFVEIKREERQEFLLKVIIDCEKTLNKSEPRHLIDMYLIEREEQMDNPEFEFRTRDYKDLCAILSDLFIAGSDTLSSTIKWMILYMAKYPQIQAKIHKEIDSVVPRSRLPQLDDKEGLPYLEAVIRDLQRIVSFVPASVPHETSQDLIIDGYNIPKGTMLNACSEFVHKDKKYWARPDELYPEHFLDENGKFKMQKEGFMPFSIGKRQCLGESMAKMELFLFISSILQNFEISEPEDNPITLEPDSVINLFNYPRDQKITFKLRK